MTSIARTGFYTSVVSYAVFVLADTMRPGFVSYVFSAHWFLLCVIIFGIWWGMTVKDIEKTDVLISKVFSGWLMKIVLSLILLIIFWRVGEVFGDMQGFLAIVAALVPWVLSFKINNKE